MLTASAESLCTVEVVTCATVVPETFIFGPVRRVDGSRFIGKVGGICIGKDLQSVHLIPLLALCAANIAPPCQASIQLLKKRTAPT